jgi:hypothetical protein
MGQRQDGELHPAFPLSRRGTLDPRESMSYGEPPPSVVRNGPEPSAGSQTQFLPFMVATGRAKFLTGIQGLLWEDRTLQNSLAFQLFFNTLHPCP